ncbi:MAG: hypothetical protein II944_04685 [Ruminobacter sp.]|jgi:hypothetical protein|nr:hypothetical protein [Ruminobacter sp.]
MSIRETTELLLEGRFICAVTCPEAFDDLNNPAVSEQITALLAPLNRKIAKTKGGNAYYAAWANLENNSDREAITREFEAVRNQLRPVVTFILELMDCDLRDHPLNVGDIVSEAEIITILENNTFLNERNVALLRQLTSRHMSDPIRIQVKFIFDHMKKFGIIAETTEGSRRFRITGKLEYIYEVLEFINSREQILEKNTDRQNLSVQGDVFNG